MGIKVQRTTIAVVEAVRAFRAARQELNALKEGVPKQQEELIPLMRKVDPLNVGIVYDPDNKKEGAAFVQQNAGSEYWDTEAIVTYLKRRKARWMSCSSRVFDAQKWEAEIANGNIPAKTAAKFKKTSTPAKPFVRFGKINYKSINPEKEGK